jgi:hypothetical protein
MSLEKEKIVANTKKFFDTATKLGFMNDDLTAFLGAEFIAAPASSMLSFNNAFEGGLIAHLINVAKYAVLINKSLPEDEQVDQNSLVKVCFLHQIGKAKMFTPCTSEWHRKNQGKMFDFVEEETSMRVGERSIFYATSHGITFTDAEYVAILNFDKTDDKMAEYHNSMIGDLLKMGGALAVRNEKNQK